MSKRPYIEMVGALKELPSIAEQEAVKATNAQVANEFKDREDSAREALNKIAVKGHALVNALRADSSDYLDTYAEYLEACDELENADNE